MIEIKDLLARFDHILLSEEAKTESLRKIISDVVGIEIPPHNVKIKNGTVYIDIKPIYKNEIFIHQEEISLLLKEALGKKAPKNIR